MRLQRFKSRKVGSKTYYKWVLNPPGIVIEGLGWSEGEELEAVAEGSKLVVRKTKPKAD